MNRLEAYGDMFEFAVMPITRGDFKKLVKNGRSSRLCDRLIEANNNESALYGFYQFEGRPTFELYLNDSPLGLAKGFKTAYKQIFHPIDGCNDAAGGKEQFFFVTERGHRKGSCQLEIDADFNARKLEFHFERYGLYNGTMCTVINPTYDGQEFEFISSDTNFESSYIISSKGQTYCIEDLGLERQMA